MDAFQYANSGNMTYGGSRMGRSPSETLAEYMDCPCRLIPAGSGINDVNQKYLSVLRYCMEHGSTPLLIPVILGLVNLTAVIILRRKISREQLLNAALAVKYALVPFYLIGGLCIAAAWILTFTPVVIMVFIGPAVALALGTAGWLVLLCSAPFSVGYLARAKKEGVHSASPQASCNFCLLPMSSR